MNTEPGCVRPLLAFDNSLCPKKKLLHTRSEKENNNFKQSILLRIKMKAAKRDKRSYIDGLATEAETAALRQCMGTLYRITKLLTGGFNSTDIPVRNQQGEIAASIQEQLKCWRDHFEKVLNRDVPSTPPNRRNQKRHQ